MKKTTGYKKLLLPILAITLLFGCHKVLAVDDVAVPGVVYSYYNKPYVKNTAGEFLFQTDITNNDSSIKKAAFFLGGFDSIDATTRKDGIVNIAGYSLLPNPNLNQFYNLAYDSLYGKVISYSIQPPSNEGSVVLKGSFYSPAPIYATNIPPISQTPNYIQPNSTFPITWKADANNTNGVNIWATYYPTRDGNWDLAAKGDSILIENRIMVPDNGSTALPSSFFSKFPTGGSLFIFIGRGNAVYVQSGQYIYLINGFFTSAFVAIKK